MALTRAQKEAVVSDVAEVAAKAYSVVGAEYRGMTVESVTELRVKAREAGVVLRVVKNTLARRAVQGTEFECVSDALVGPMILAFSMEDPGAAARVIKEFAKQDKLLNVQLVSVGGEVYPPAEIDRLATLPTKDQAIGILMGVMKAPAEKLVRTLVAPHTKLVRTIVAVREQKEAA